MTVERKLMRHVEHFNIDYESYQHDVNVQARDTRTFRFS